MKLSRRCGDASDPMSDAVLDVRSESITIVVVVIKLEDAHSNRTPVVSRLN